VLSKVSAVRVRAGCWADGLHTHSHPSQFLPPDTGSTLFSPSSPHASPLFCLLRGLHTAQAGQGVSEPASSPLESTTWRLSRSYFQPIVQEPSANAQHQRPLLGPSFEGEARGGREPVAPTRAKTRRSSSGLLVPANFCLGAGLRAFTWRVGRRSVLRE